MQSNALRVVKFLLIIKNRIPFLKNQFPFSTAYQDTLRKLAKVFSMLHVEGTKKMCYNHILYYIIFAHKTLFLFQRLHVLTKKNSEESFFKVFKTITFNIKQNANLLSISPIVTKL